MATLEARILKLTWNRRMDFETIQRSLGMCGKPIEVIVAIKNLMDAGKLRISAIKCLDGSVKYIAV